MQTSYWYSLARGGLTATFAVVSLASPSTATSQAPAAQPATATDTARPAPRTDSVTIPLTVAMPERVRLSPSVPQVALASMGIGTLEAMSLAMAGMNVDYDRCSRKHRGERGGFFTDPCFLEVADGTRVGWLAGSFGGSVGGAVAMARIRGCPLRPAFWRSTGGTILGMLPGIITLATPSRKTPARRSWLIGTTPVLGGIGATLAVAGCHR